ncbi:DUF3597 domain-containing protein [Sphingomicrobium nitratireducens]|uniref:DUF3597 domain-containing protein n=1 Tax=Sphingomicrobium nitratireducens TaxID=2964666 RepID=UPI0022400BB3|nr:DUF3597 domain-containing protein [Sphingomicrobium nitratireducens]
MGIFSKIKDAIFGKKARANPNDGVILGNAPTGGLGAGDATAQTVDVEAVLEDKYERAGQDLNWRTSIVDLMKLLDLDSSYDNRKELAQEMGRTDYSGSAEDNIWLHKRVMQELEQHGGRVPASLRD